MDVDPPKSVRRGEPAPPMYDRVNVARPITPEEWSQIADTAPPGLVPKPSRKEEAEEAMHPRKRLDLAEAALKADPTNPDMFCQLAGVQMELGMQAQGMINYLRAAEGYGRTGQDEKTMQIYNLLTMISPDDYALHGQMVMLALRLHNAQEAVEKLKWLCNELIERGRQNEAVEVVDRVLDEHPLVLEVLLMKTRMLMACERGEEAVRHLGQSVGLMVANNKIAEAHELVEQGLEIDPGNPLWSQLRDDIVGEMRRTGMNPIIDDEEEDPGLSDWLPDIDKKS
jgi:tetratricopeptide (TPR) repeat protein